MSEQPDTKPARETYIGPSTPALALLEGRVYGFFGGLLGLVGGAALSGTVFKSEDEIVKKFGANLKHFGVPLEGKVGLVVTSALIGSAVAHRIGNVVGIAVGVKNSGDPVAQFDRTQARIVDLEHKMESLESGAVKSFAKREEQRAIATPDHAVER